ncbi:uncharacterized protein [Amphiura filiformis]|uniref:uncharacterized protein n=1 Tax=Amphiura filiformis TaxID=82378 RepID=UPI003B22707A
MAEGNDLEKIVNFATGRDIEPGKKKKLQVRNSDGLVFTMKMQKKVTTPKLMKSPIKWVKGHLKKKKKGGHDVIDESNDDLIYEVGIPIFPGDIGLNEIEIYGGTSQLATETLFSREAVYQNINFDQNQLSTSCTELYIRDRSRSSRVRNIPNYTARKSTATEILYPLDRPMLTPPIMYRSAPSLLCMSDVKSQYDEDQTEHSYLELGSQVRQHSDDPDDDIYVFRSLPSKDAHVPSTNQRLSQCSIQEISSAMSMEPDEVDDHNDEYTRIPNDDGEAEDNTLMYATPYAKMRLSKHGSQHSPKDAHVLSANQTSRCDDHEDMHRPERLSQCSINIPEIEKNALIGPAMPKKPVLIADEVDDYNDEYATIPKDDGEEDDTLLYATPYAKMRSRSKVESQYAPIETEENTAFFIDCMRSIDSTGYQTDGDRLSYLTDLHKELQIQHPNPPARTADASEIMSPAKGIRKQDNEQEDSLRSSDSSTFDSMDSEEDRLKYLLNLHSDMEKGEGGYCTFSRNAHVPLQNEPGYMNMPYDGLIGEHKFTNDAKRADVANQSEVVSSNSIDTTRNLEI